MMELLIMIPRKELVLNVMVSSRFLLMISSAVLHVPRVLNGEKKTESVLSMNSFVNLTMFIIQKTKNVNAQKINPSTLVKNVWLAIFLSIGIMI